MFMHTRICVKKSAVIVHSTSTLSDGSMPKLCILMSRWFAVAHVHLDRHSDGNLSTDVLDLLPRRVRHARHVNEEVVRADPNAAVPAISSGERVENRPYAERRQDMRRDLQVEIASDRP